MGERSRQFPIASASEDRLGRARFAELIGRAMERFSGDESYVIALHGRYGSGKTSVINMALERFDTRTASAEGGVSSQAPIVFRFEPLLYSTTGDLYVQFFSKFGERLETDLRLRGLRGLMVAFGASVQPAGKLLDASTGQSGVFSAIGVGLSRLFQKLGNWLQRFEKDPERLKAHISRLLRAGDRRMVIVMDDIDRLASEEIRDIFRLVKAVADFPNTLYLLVFDLDIASKALSNVQGVPGEEYIEKIVQAPFRLPEPDSAQLVGLLLEGVTELVARIDEVPEEDAKDLLDQAYLLNTFGFDRLLGSVRQANRVLEALEFTLPAVAGEVRLRDFVVLEVLRICRPSTYERLLDRQDYLLGIGEGLFSRDLSLAGKPDETASLVNDAVAYISSGAANGDQRTAVSNLLRELFQLAEWSHRGSGFGGNEFVTQWQNDRRVCAPEIFRTATAWTLPENVAPSGLMLELVEIEDAPALRSRLEELSASSEAGPGLTHLVDRLVDSARRNEQ